MTFDQDKSHLCKYHHNPGAVLDRPNAGYSKSRCPGCGMYYIEMTESTNYVSPNNYTVNDDMDDFERRQNEYDPPEPIRNDDGSIEYW